MKFNPTGFSKSSMWSISTRELPTYWDLQLTSSGHSQFLFHLLIFLRKARWDPWVKRSLSCSIPDLAGGHGLGRDGGKKLHCESRGGTLRGFGPFGFCVDGFCRHCWPLLIRHSFWRSRQYVLEGKKHDKQTGSFFLSFKPCGKQWKTNCLSHSRPPRPGEPRAKDCMTIAVQGRESICVPRKVTCAWSCWSLTFTKPIQ